MRVFVGPSDQPVVKNTRNAATELDQLINLFIQSFNSCIVVRCFSVGGVVSVDFVAIVQSIHLSPFPDPPIPHNYLIILAWNYLFPFMSSGFLLRNRVQGSFRLEWSVRGLLRCSRKSRGRRRRRPNHDCSFHAIGYGNSSLPETKNRCHYVIVSTVKVLSKRSVYGDLTNCPSRFVTLGSFKSEIFSF